MDIENDPLIAHSLDRGKRSWAEAAGSMRDIQPKAEPEKNKLHFSLLIFLICVLLSFVAWDHYLNSPDLIDQQVASYLVLISGLFFSCLSGFAVWTLESKAEYLESEVVKRVAEMNRKDMEQRLTDTASIATCWLSQMIFSSQKDENLFDSIIHLMKKVLQADEVSLMLKNDQDELYIAAASGIPQSIIETTRIKMGERVAGRAAQCRREFLIIGKLSDYREFEGISPSLHIRSSIICPLIAGNEVLGVLNLNRTITHENFTDIHLRHAMIIASQLAQVLWNEKVQLSIVSKSIELDAAYQKLRGLGIA